MRISEIESGKEEIYGGIKLESERRRIMADYERVEDPYNKFVKNKISSGDLSNSLGSAVIGLSGEHPSAQIYAYELLLKSLAEAETLEDQNTIIEEAIFDAVQESQPVKKEYLLGLLAYFTSRDLMEQREQTQSGAQLADEKKIFSAFQNYQAGLTPEKTKTWGPKMNDFAALISNDFPKTSEEGQIARLVAKYYSNEQHATTPPGPRRSMVVDVLSKGAGGPGGSGRPERIYVLPPGYHTSLGKVQEAERYGLPLLTEFAQIQNIPQGREKKALLWDISPEESLAYIKKLRELKDQGDFAGAMEFTAAYRRKLWDELDESTRQELGGNIEGIEILVQTIRDESADEISGKQELEQGQAASA